MHVYSGAARTVPTETKVGGTWLGVRGEAGRFQRPRSEQQQPKDSVGTDGEQVNTIDEDEFIFTFQSKTHTGVSLWILILQQTSRPPDHLTGIQKMTSRVNNPGAGRATLRLTRPVETSPHLANNSHPQPCPARASRVGSVESRLTFPADSSRATIP